MKTLPVVLAFLSTGYFAVAQETASTKSVNSPTTANVGGSGTQNYIPIWTDSADLGISLLYQVSGKVGIGTTAPSSTLDVNGAINTSTGFNLGGTVFAFGSVEYSNAFVGFAGNSTMSGHSDVAVGVGALSANTTGANNTASGAFSLALNTTGHDNTACGYQALSNTTGNYNTACGSNAMANGNTALTSGNANTAIGWEALFFNVQGGSNVASGGKALYYNTIGTGNTASGYAALVLNTTGDKNTVSGDFGLSNNTTGSFNTALGYMAGPDTKSTNLTNSTAIGANAVVSESNALVLGGTGQYAVKVGIGTATPTSVFTIAEGAGHAISDGWSTYSSKRWKTNIHTLHDALGKVQQLRGVSYDLKINGKHEIGVIAEEVGAVVPEIVTWDNNGKGNAQGVDYSRLTTLLIEATKEQQALINEQQKQISMQQAQIAALASQVRTIQASLGRSN